MTTTLPELKSTPITWENPMHWRIPHKKISGVDLGYTGWSPGFDVPPIHIQNGFDALVLDGGTEDGDLTDVTMPRFASGGDSTVVIDANMRVVIFRRFRFHGDGHNIIRLGITSRNAIPPKPLWVEFHECEFTTDGGTVKQGITGHQAGVRFWRCRIGEAGFRSVEHFAYLRGQVYGPGGCSLVVQECDLEIDECSEIFKGPTRVSKHMGNTLKHGEMDGMWPLRGPDNERPMWLIEDSILHRRRRSSMEGGGIVLQDGDKHLVVRRSLVAIEQGGHIIACDAHAEGVGPDGVTLGYNAEGGHPGNGNIVVEDSILVADPPKDGATLVRINSAEGCLLARTVVGVVGKSIPEGHTGWVKSEINGTWGQASPCVWHRPSADTPPHIERGFALLAQRGLLEGGELPVVADTQGPWSEPPGVDA